MVYCANCTLEIVDEEFVRCADTGVPLHKECAAECIECGALITDEVALKNKFKCKTCYAPPKVDISVVRRSYLEDYKLCPYKVKLRLVDELESVNNPYAESGIILHDLFDEYYTRGMTKENMKKRYTEAMQGVKSYDRVHLEKGLPKTLQENGMIAIDNFYVYDQFNGKPFKTEETIKYSLGDDLPNVQITYDRLEEDLNGDLHLVDYKTGRVHVGKKLAEDLQIVTYAHAIYEKYGKYPKTFKLLFLAEDKERIYYFDESDMTYTCTVRRRHYVQNVEEKLEEVRGILEDIKMGRFQVPIQDLSMWYCNKFCEYLGTHCQGVEKQAWDGSAWSLE